MNEQPHTPEQKQLDAIAEAADTQRRRLCFMRSPLFVGAGWLFSALVTADFILRQLTGEDCLLWLFAPGLLIGCMLMVFYIRRHRTITATDRMLMNIWMYSLLICLYTGIWQGPEDGLPLMGFLTMGASIAVGVTSEIYRLNDSNHSNIRGSLVGLGWIALAGAFLSAHIFVAARGDAPIGQFVVTLAAVVILFFGTGAVLRHNERRSHV